MAKSMKQVAAAAGVSVGTVSNVLNAPDKVAPATVKRVMSAIDRLGFVRNDAARQLRAGRSRCVGLVVLDIGNPFFTEIARGVESSATDRGLTVLLGSTDDDPERERLYLDTFDEQRVHGLLVSPVGEDLERLELLQSRGTPVVLVDRDGTGTSFSSVAVDDIAGGELAVRHLCEQGRRRIAYVGGPTSLRQVADRLRGARMAAEAAGAVIEVVPTREPSVLAGRAAAASIAERAPKDRPDAIFCANDLLALGVLQSLVMLGNSVVPDDIAVIGYDDIDFAASAVVSLSSIRQPSRDIGRAAVDLLEESAQDHRAEPRHVQFQPTLTIRDSTS
ncbi:LacI family transcriptional regulator [Rhodococcus sp. 15-649-1-2]|nr:MULTISPECIES: LacI family DNA-binding transcriptional regulator [Rhodococcus]OZC58677.1 LacI family transcriptional regulator [Rhodococcus sp. 06-621-2]OZD11294.1 LacI family transcriptional regulator [Rhodococcus sp. 06-156-3C]OZD13527.1 LacI family transcriptional regulator [Rhodococcus sp. 06-156-4a]OZD22132.1 LacI family transcriptional regulator [Rhodococcus sp. 06-156-4C]OZD30152.1 LacI family transcriptional regulator [Rhodococcus sp. 06-156-3]